MTFQPRLSLAFVSRAAALGLTQKQVAEAVGVSAPAVHKFKSRHGIAFQPRKLAARKPMSPMTTVPEKVRLIDAYNAREAACGGIENADIELCITLAAADCGLSYPQAADILRQHWAGLRG